MFEQFEIDNSCIMLRQTEKDTESIRVIQKTVKDVVFITMYKIKKS